MSTIVLVAGAVAAVTVLVIILYVRAQKRKRLALIAEAERIIQLYDFFRFQLPEISEAVNKFESAIDDRHYFNHFKWQPWKNANESLYQAINGKDYKTIFLIAEEVSTIDKFLDYFSKGENIRSQYNENFVQRELNSSANEALFTLSTNKLDRQQRKAIVTDEDNNLIIAGAGSGKTTTIIGKLKYVIEKQLTEPQRILAISFTRKSSQTLEQKISQYNIGKVKVKTFNGFGLEAIKICTNEVPRCLDDLEFNPLIENIFSGLIKDKSYLKQLIDFFTNYMKVVTDEFDIETKKDQVLHNKAQIYKTFKGEMVKSHQELQIANWLFFHRLAYEYEPLYPHKYTTSEGYKASYRPDFGIKHGNTMIYLEHFGINQDGSVPPFFRKDGQTQEEANEKYKSDRLLKIAAHREHGTVLIETFSHQFHDQTVFEHLKNQLEQFSLRVYPITEEEKWAIIKERVPQEVKGMMQLIRTFLVLQKSNNYSVNDVKTKANRLEDKQAKTRARKFLEVFIPIYNGYEEQLKQKELIDFSDMINKAAELIERGLYAQPLDYIIIDEFQDISLGRYQLIKALKKVNPSCKLFCVGDDWQSIFRFTGSDISLFKDFDKFFGVTAHSKIETTYRFNDPLIKISSGFIQKNPNQQSKDLRGFFDRSTDVRLIYSEEPDVFNSDINNALKTVFDSLITTYHELPEMGIMLIGRYNHDINKISSRGGFQVHRNQRIIENNEERVSDVIAYTTAYRTYQAEFLTAHRSKGLEADIVIILNCNSGRHGFPSEIADDPLLNLLLSEADQFENGEERRLFYVAMTRAKQELFFIANRHHKSKFISELETTKHKSISTNCPICENGDVVIRKQGTTVNGSPYTFYGCSNYVYGCDYNKSEYH